MNATFSPTSPTSPFTLIPGNAQQLGNRAEQQDSFGFSDLSDSVLLDHCGALAVVADGMGGHALGHDASQHAKQVFLTDYPAKPPEEPIPDALVRVLRQANEAVCSLARRGGHVNNAGTTLAAAVIHRNQLYWISVGDSRIYLCRRGQLSLLTNDHVYDHKLEQEVAQGRLSMAEASQHPDRGALTSYLGIPELTQIDRNLRPYPLQTGDRILLCTDGLYQGLDEAEITEELTRADPQTAAQALVTRVLAKHYPHQDNVTAITLACTEPSAMPQGQRSPVRRRLSLSGLASGMLLTGLGVVIGLLLSRYGDKLPWADAIIDETPPVEDVEESLPRADKSAVLNSPAAVPTHAKDAQTESLTELDEGPSAADSADGANESLPETSPSPGETMPEDPTKEEVTPSTDTQQKPDTATQESTEHADQTPLESTPSMGQDGQTPEP